MDWYHNVAVLKVKSLFVHFYEAAPTVFQTATMYRTVDHTFTLSSHADTVAWHGRDRETNHLDTRREIRLERADACSDIHFLITHV